LLETVRNAIAPSHENILRRPDKIAQMQFMSQFSTLSKFYSTKCFYDFCLECKVEKVGEGEEQN